MTPFLYYIFIQYHSKPYTQHAGTSIGPWDALFIFSFISKRMYELCTQASKLMTSLSVLTGIIIMYYMYILFFLL